MFNRKNLLILSGLLAIGSGVMTAEAKLEADDAQKIQEFLELAQKQLRLNPSPFADDKMENEANKMLKDAFMPVAKKIGEGADLKALKELGAACTVLLFDKPENRAELIAEVNKKCEELGINFNLS